MGKKSKEVFLIIFVEGQTEEVFYKEILEYIKKKNNNKATNLYDIKNLKGIGKFKSKMVAIFKNSIMKKYSNYEVHVVCAYDTDVFEYSSNPPVKWNEKVKELKEAGATKVHLIGAKKMIEDWFLLDVKGICSFLKTKNTSNPKGKDGNRKMIELFKRANKPYIKGEDTGEFIKVLDINKIYKAKEEKLKCLEEIIYKNK